MLKWHPSMARPMAKEKRIAAYVHVCLTLLIVAGVSAVGVTLLTLASVTQAQTIETNTANLNAAVDVPATDPSVLELNDQISERRKKIDELTQQATAFEQTVKEKEKQAFSLSNELSKIDDQVVATNVSLETARVQIQKIELEIRVLEQQLAEKEDEIGWQRDRMGELIRQLYRERQRSMLEVVVVDQSFAKFFSTIQGLTQLQDDVRSSLDRLTALQHDLQINQEDLTGKHSEFTQTEDRLTVLKDSLDQQQAYKARLLTETQSSQSKFESLLDDIRGEADSVNAEISTLEKRVRERLGQTDETSDKRLGTGELQWPVDASRGISAYFHDPTYPFRCTSKNQRNCIGEHSAIDIRVPQGTAVQAASDGYVAIARRLDWIRNDTGKIIRPAYNYITLLHADGLSTVYGHLSSVKVVEDTYVKKGQVIGLSGALPGTAGAGTWTTGAHLHFEVRKDGIPVDPLGYLP